MTYVRKWWHALMALCGRGAGVPTLPGDEPYRLDFKDKSRTDLRQVGEEKD